VADPFIGEIRLYGFNFAPVGWAFCDGSLLSISQNTALFSLLGTTFGGDGRATFALPDLRSRVPVNMGQGPGLSGYTIGQSGGVEKVDLTAAQVAAHTHPLLANGGGATGQRAGGAVLATAGSPIYAASTDGTSMNAGAVGPNSGGQPFTILPPSLALNFCIALQGVFPSRS
jgi:microcystin-dependent protein